MPSKIQHRRGTATQWSTVNPVLSEGEIGFVTDENRFKVGDGVTAWNTLEFPAVSPAWSSITGKPAIASQAEMEAGSEAGIRQMSPLDVAQAIASLVPPLIPAPVEPTSASVTYNTGGTTTVNTSLADVFHVTASGATTWAFTNANASPLLTEFTLELTNGGTQTWPASVKWDGGAAPSLSTTGLDILYFYSRNGGTTWVGFLAAKGVA